MSSNPLVSVITPTFNRADYLPFAVESVLSQSVPDFELIVIDDGSTDGTAELMERYLADSRIRYLKQENQGGQSVARNRGIAEALGQFICFLDSDNAWVSTKLETSLKAFEEHPEVDIVYGDFITIDGGEGHEHGVNRMARYSGRITPQLLRDNFVSMNTTMTRKRCFDEMGGALTAPIGWRRTTGSGCVFPPAISFYMFQRCLGITGLWKTRFPLTRRAGFERTNSWSRVF